MAGAVARHIPHVMEPCREYHDEVISLGKTVVGRYLVGRLHHLAGMREVMVYQHRVGVRFVLPGHIGLRGCYH